jgi:hypothetical protein
MRPRFRCALPLLVAFAALLAIATPAQAKNQLLHAKFQRALLAGQLDSTLFTMQTTTFDTLEYIITDNINPTAVAAIDSNTTVSLAAIAHAPKNMALVVEVTGLMQSMDSLYVGFQFSQGSTSALNGSSGDQTNPYNWRWYDAQLTSAGGTVVNATGSQTFVFPVPCAVGGPNAWTWAKAMRFILQGDNTAAAKAFSTRAWLVTRD